MTLTYRIYLAIRDGQADTSPALAALLLVSRDRITETISAMRRRGILRTLPGCTGHYIKRYELAPGVVVLPEGRGAHGKQVEHLAAARARYSELCRRCPTKRARRQHPLERAWPSVVRAGRA